MPLIKSGDGSQPFFSDSAIGIGGYYQVPAGNIYAGPDCLLFPGAFVPADRHIGDPLETGCLIKRVVARIVVDNHYFKKMRRVILRLQTSKKGCYVGFFIAAGNYYRQKEGGVFG